MRNTMRHFAVAISLMLAMTLPSFSQQHPIVEKDYVAYLFTYFTGNHISEEAVCYAVSMDGYTYWALNDGKPVLDSKVISSTGGVRDPAYSEKSGWSYLLYGGDRYGIWQWLGFEPCDGAAEVQ